MLGIGIWGRKLGEGWRGRTGGIIREGSGKGTEERMGGKRIGGRIGGRGCG